MVRSDNMVFTLGPSGTPSNFVNAGWPWYNFRSSCIVRFVQGGVVKTYRWADAEMAWGGLIFVTPPNATLESLPSDYDMPSLGGSPEVRSALASLFPSDFHTQGQSNIRTDTCWIELNYNSDGSVVSIGVRSNADETALSILKTVCHHFSARLFDNQTGDFADFGTESISSLASFRDFRDRNAPPHV